MVAATSTASLLTCAFLPSPGFSELTRSLVLKNKQKQCKRRYGPQVVTAKINLKPPPYMLNALEPHMSKETLEYHWGRHHRGYVENLNKQIVGTELDGLTLEGVVLVSYNKGDILPAFNNAAQTWNHEFFWESMAPGGGGAPSGDLLKLINRDFGSFALLLKNSSWQHLLSLVLVGPGLHVSDKANRLDVGNAVNPLPTEEDKKLVVVKSPNAVNPLVWDYFPLLTIDVWEHSYYIDFENRRAEYISTFLEKLVSWETVSMRLEIAKSRSTERDKEAESKRREEEEANLPGGEATEMYLESEGEESEAE